MDSLITKIKSVKTEKTLKVKPENIKKDVSIFGITGTYTSDANATANDIVTGKTAYVNGSKITGQFAGVDTSDATATASDIVTNKTAYVNGQKITGSYAGIIPSGTLNITANNTYDVTNYASAEVTVSSSGSVETKDVNFYDYEGTLLYSYTKTEFSQLSALPENPSHEGLVAQGWNWALADAKTFMNTHDRLDIGQMYNTVDNVTRIYITLSEGRLSPYCGFGLNGTVTIDWGDNSTPSSVTGTSQSTTVYTQHEYAAAGDYVIEISGNTEIKITGLSSGSNMITKNYSNSARDNDVYRNCITKVELGNVTFGTYSFACCYSLKNVLLSTHITSLSSYCFNQCYNLETVVFPTSITTINTAVFSQDFSLSRVVMSKYLTSASDSCFSSCVSLKNIVVPGITYLPSNLFSNCSALEYVEVSDNWTGSSTYVFNNCSALKKIKLPSGLLNIYNYHFQNCYSLSKVEFPSTVAAIYGNAFYGCYGVRVFDLSNHSQVPTINSSTFQGIAADCQFVVPDSLYETWIAASYWSSLSSKIVKVSEFQG